MSQPDAGAPMVEARSLAKDFGAVKAVAGISFRIQRGEIVGFLGPNGAGKTTTMRMLTGYLRPTQGAALVGGTDVAEDSLATRRRIGYLPESAPLYGDMMVLDFLEYVADLRGVPREGRRDKLRGICRRCGLLDKLGADISTLSKGYRQRVGLAQAMVHDPDLLVLDEPTSGLDPNQIVEIRELVRELGREKTVILSTHILPEVQAVCSRVVIIADGKLVADDTPAALVERESGSTIRVLVRARAGAADPEKARALLAGVAGVRQVSAGEAGGDNALSFRLATAGKDDPREAVFLALAGSDLSLLELHREAVSLEDTFRRLTRGDGGARA